jgi:hypothetical protein
VIALVLIGVGGREAGDRPIELGTASQVCGDREPVAGAGVGAPGTIRTRVCRRATPNRSRTAISALAAIRFTSHSHGPGSVSSQSFGPKISPTILGRESAEVRDVSVAAGLNNDPRVRRPRQVCRHHGRRPAVERERGEQHPPVADRDQLLNPRRRLSPEYFNRIGAIRSLCPLAIGRAAHPPACRTTSFRGFPGPQRRHLSGAGRGAAEVGN